MTWIDLLLYCGAVYGVAWGITRSSLLRAPREAVADVPLLGKLVQCIVCTGTWIAVGLALLLPYSELFSAGFVCSSPVDLLFLVAFAVTTTWAAGRALGDAD